MICILAVSTMYAQEDTLQKQKDWKFDGVIGLNAGATNLVFWPGGGNDNANALAFAKLRLLYEKNAVAWESNFDTDFGLTWVD